MSNTVANSGDEGKKGLISRIRSGLNRTRSRLAAGLGNVFLGEKAIDDELLEEIEDLLLSSDVGVSATTEIIERLTRKVARKELGNVAALYENLKQELTELLVPVQVPLEVETARPPFVILMVGVNGAGKTTTIGKLAKRLQAGGKSVLLAAGDTFRAAATEQLTVWGERNRVDVISQQAGADSASVIYDALEAARARHIDVLIADTAGRLQNRKNLMEELGRAP
jgi:fused signal recognition particle receptor